MRVRSYSDEEPMVADAFELAREATLRAAIAGCDLGGAAIVATGAPVDVCDREAYFRSVGRHIEQMGGRVYGVMDVGMDDRDLVHVKRETDFVLALPRAHGGLGDPAEMTAHGVVAGVRAVVKNVWGEAKIENMSILVQGMGRLGMAVLRKLAEAKARVSVTDLNYDKIKSAQDAFGGVSVVAPGDALSTKCDVLVPCALGNAVTTSTAGTVRCRAIAGGAGNILPDLDTADVLHKQGVLYVPHFVIDAGELIQADCERKRWSSDLARGQVGEIYGRALQLLEAARDDKTSPTRLAIHMAERRIATIGQLRSRVFR
jgi:glutamate dehydrogenase/leucine dehydrogenase